MMFVTAVMIESLRQAFHWLLSGVTQRRCLVCVHCREMFLMCESDGSDYDCCADCWEPRWQPEWITAEIGGEG